MEIEKGIYGQLFYCNMKSHRLTFYYSKCKKKEFHLSKLSVLMEFRLF